MKRRFAHIILVLLLFCLFFACSTTKNIPQGEYLLNSVKVNVDNKDVSKNELSAYIKQKPNDPKLRLRIYNMIGNDTTSWLKRTIRKMGKPPVIYSARSTEQSAKEMKAEMKNKGYLNAEVTTAVDTVKKKANVSYHVVSNDPYKIKTYKIDIQDTVIDSILVRRSKRGRSLLKSGTIFDMAKLETERTKVSQLLRNNGFYASTEENLHYLADTTLRTNQVNLSMILKDSSMLKQYYIRNVSIYSGYDPVEPETYKIVDSVNYNNVQIYYDSTYLMKPSVLYENILVYPGKLYTERSTNRTFSYLNGLGSISKASIRYDEVTVNDTAMLDCRIDLSPANMHAIQMGIDGTNKEGDLGVAANVSYTHHNIFNGAENLNVKLRGAYEFVNNTTNSALTHNYYEFGIGTSLSFPRAHIPFIGKATKQRLNISTEYGASFDVQRRPEYARNFFNLSWKNKWINEAKTISQSLSILDINYVMMPYISDEFEEYLNKPENVLTKYSYEDVFTAGISYNITYSNANIGKADRKLYTIRLNAESSGNGLDAIFSLANAKKSENGQYTILGNPFAQYVKGDFDFSESIKLTDKTSLAFHTSLGVAYPYGNSKSLDYPAILPFEKRYYAGGANSIRGWSTRALGPGSYNDTLANISTHVGDIRLLLNAEYRYKWIKWMELAVFVDAGNIWTINDYENQAGGQFSPDTFYKEIALATGIGFRFDLSFLILRIDAGKRIYDPAREEGKRWTFFEKFRNNSGIFLAIGYPF